MPRKFIHKYVSSKKKLLISLILISAVWIIYMYLSFHGSNASLHSSSLERPGRKESNEQLFLELKDIHRRQDQEEFLLLVICIILLLSLIPKFDPRFIIKRITDSFYYILKPTNHSTNKLENSICVVGFDEGESQRKHVEMAKDLVGNSCKLQMKSVVVTSLDSLINIPPSKMFLMFVDYNERNIIIEDDSIKDGIRRQTLDMLQEKGAEVVVVYCWELSSSRLEEGQLFAPKLASIGQVPRLRQLRDHDAIYSIYKNFNQHQKATFQRKLGGSAIVVI